MDELRVRSKISKEALEERKGKILTDADSWVRLTGPGRVLMPDGRPLCVYLPRAVKEQMTEAYATLTTIRGTTTNRGLASGTPRTHMSKTRSYSMPVMSGILGSFEAAGNFKFCRLTAWTAKELEDRWPGLFPLFQGMGNKFREHVPDRYAAQMKEVRKTPPEWVIPNTPYTTITVNNSYSTGVHQDKGDLDQGFSCLSVARRGNYTGGVFTFPEYRVSVDLQDGDLILMDAHQWHGNTTMTCECGNTLNKGPCKECGAERVSVVAYFRTNVVQCGTSAEEEQRHLALEEKAWEKQNAPTPA